MSVFRFLFRAVRVWPALVLAGGAVAATPPSPASVGADFAQASTALRGGHWSAAYARFVRLADAGHAPSASIARWMHANAATFGTRWSATPAQLRYWGALEAASSGAEPTDDLGEAE